MPASVKQPATLLKSNYKVLTKLEEFYTGGKVQFTSDCDYMFCTCGDSIKVLDTDNGTVKQSIKEDEDEITSFIVSPDDKYLFTAKRSLLLRMWNWRENSLIRKFKAIHTAPIVSMAFDKSSTLLATGSSDKTIKIWDTVRQYCTHNFKGSAGVVSLVQFHPDAEKLQLFSTSTDCRIRIWDLKTSRCLSVLDGHFSTVTSICFTHDNMFMISGGRDKVILIWDLSSRCQLNTIPVYESIEGVITVPVSSNCPGSSDDEDECLFISVEGKGNLKVWRFSDRKCVHQVQPYSDLSQLNQTNGVKDTTHANPVITQIMVCEALGSLACVTHDHSIILYDLFSLSRQKQFVGYFDEILEVRMFDQKRRSLAIATNSTELKLLELETSDCHILCGHTDTILSMDLSFDDTLIATCSKDNSIRIWEIIDIKNGRRECNWKAYGVGHMGAVGTVCWPKNSKRFLITGSEDHTIKRWEVPAKFPDQESIQLYVKWTEKAHDKDINSSDISPNDKLIVTGSQDKTAKIWMSDSGKLLGTLRGHRRGIWCAHFSPVDQCIATGSADSSIKIWAIADFTCVKTLEGHSNSVLKVQFMTNGMQLLSSGSDGLIKLWNVRTNECTRTFDEHEDKVWALSIAKDEDVFVSGGADSALVLWEDITEQEIEENRAKQEDFLLKEQKLSNLLQQRHFLQAISLAITLEKPYKVLSIFKDILSMDDGKSLVETLSLLNDSQINTLLEFITGWNTNGKNAFTAQHVLSIILKTRKPSVLVEYPNMKEVIEALLSYSERHFQRVNKMIQQSSFIEYSWEKMKLRTVHTEKLEENTLEKEVTNSEDQSVYPKNDARSYEVANVHATEGEPGLKRRKKT